MQKRAVPLSAISAASPNQYLYNASPMASPEPGPRNSGLRAFFLILLLLAVSLLLLLNGCAASRATASEGRAATGSYSADSALFAAEALDDASALAAVRLLENQPLDTAAPGLRRKLFAWLVSSPALSRFASATPPVDELQKSGFPYKEELMMQYLFGSAALVVGSSENPPDLPSQQEAGLRSMIVAYRNMVQSRPEARDSFLDDLDGMRRRGELRDYLKEVIERGRTR